MHVHLGGKEAENILDSIKVKTCRRLELKEAFQDFPVT